jgi:hypothetical protein
MRSESTTEMTSVSAALSELCRALDVTGRVRRHPYATLAATVGAGYVLGGGLFTRLTARVVRTTGRIGAELAVVPLLMKAIATSAPNDSIDRAR